MLIVKSCTHLLKYVRLESISLYTSVVAGPVIVRLPVMLSNWMRKEVWKGERGGGEEGEEEGEEGKERGGERRWWEEMEKEREWGGKGRRNGEKEGHVVNLPALYICIQM